ncbi:MAG: hypothetical protein KatS3mg102_1962 [Planctomycetota bacterium]|nr:MAG: hypothetical protein KatS3mg102_1962 [Planctomycetota bacterium]
MRAAQPGGPRAAAALGAAVLLAAAPLAGAVRAAERPRTDAAAALRLERAEELLALGLVEPALGPLAQLLEEPLADGQLRARAGLGAARAALALGRDAQAFDLLGAVARLGPQAAAEADLLRLEALVERWRLGEARSLAQALAQREELAPHQRARAQAAARWLEPLERAPPVVLAARFEARPEGAWLLTDPERLRWLATRGLVELRVGMQAGAGAAAVFVAPYGPLGFVRPAPYAGGAAELRFVFRIADLRGGASVRVGLFTAGAVPLGEHGVARGAEVSLAIGAGGGEGIRVAGPEPAPWQGGAPAVRLIVADGEQVQAVPLLPAARGLALDAWYEARIEIVPAAGAFTPEGLRARASVRERGLSTAPELRAEAVLYGAPDSGPWALGVAGPRGEVEAGEGILQLESFELRAQPLLGAPPALLQQPAVRRLLEANLLAALQDGAAALERYEQALAADPALPAAVYGRAMLLSARGELIEAAANLAEIAWSVPRAREELLRAVSELQARGAWAELLEVLAGATVRLPGDPQLRALLEEARVRTLAAMDAEVVRAPQARLQRARLALLAGAPARARDEVQLALALAPSPTAELLLVRAEAELALGRSTQAGLDCMRALQLQQASPHERAQAFSLLGRVLLERARAGGAVDPGQAHSAAAALRRAAALAPTLAEPRVLLARAELLAGRPAAAERAAREAVRLAPRLPAAWQALAEAAAACGEPATARQALERARRLGPTDPLLEEAVAAAQDRGPAPLPR